MKSFSTAILSALCLLFCGCFDFGLAKADSAASETNLVDRPDLIDAANACREWGTREPPQCYLFTDSELVTNDWKDICDVSTNVLQASVVTSNYFADVVYKGKTNRVVLESVKLVDKPLAKRLVNQTVVTITNGWYIPWAWTNILNQAVTNNCNYATHHEQH